MNSQNQEEWYIEEEHSIADAALLGEWVGKPTDVTRIKTEQGISNINRLAFELFKETSALAMMASHLGLIVEIKPIA